MLIRNKEWSHDMFSLGVVFLELVIGWPVWLHMQCHVTSVCDPRVEIKTTGIFSANLRDKFKIKERQVHCINNLDLLLENSMGVSNLGDYGKDLLKKMIVEEGSKRISPYDALTHPFFTK